MEPIFILYVRFISLLPTVEFSQILGAFESCFQGEFLHCAPRRERPTNHPLKGSMNSTSEWTNVHDAWGGFVAQHPELNYRAGAWQLHNFLRFHRDYLIARDAIRKARGRHWIAHSTRFPTAAFEAATHSGPSKVATVPQGEAV